MRRLLLPFMTLAAALASAPAWAGAVVIWPIDPTIAKGERATALWVENQGQEPMSVQIRAFAWTQPNGKDDLAEQDEVVASPPIATVPAGGRQLVRLMRRTPGAGVPERSYRLLIDELPAPPQPGAAPATPRLAVQMRYSIPLFTYDLDPAAVGAVLTARLEDQGDRRVIVIRNTGAKHARLVDLRAVTAEGAQSLLPGLVGYVLPGQTMRWPLPKDPGAAGQFKVNVNGDEHTLLARS